MVDPTSLPIPIPGMKLISENTEELSLSMYVRDLVNHIMGEYPKHDMDTATKPKLPEEIYAVPEQMKKQKFACDICNGEFSTKFNRDRHMQGCAEKKKENPEIPKMAKVNENIDVKLNSRSMKCYVTKDGGIEGKLIIPCTINFQDIS